MPSKLNYTKQLENILSELDKNSKSISILVDSKLTETKKIGNILENPLFLKPEYVENIYKTFRMCNRKILVLELEKNIKNMNENYENVIKFLNEDVN